MNPAESSPNIGFLREAGARLRLHWPTKSIGLSAGLIVFFVAYFQLLNRPLFPVTVMPLTAVDRFIGFQPAALPLYLSLWLFVSLAFGFLQSRRALLSCGVSAGLLAATGLGLFLLWPTAVPDRGIAWSAHPSFAFLKEVDASGNACPSLHVAFAVFAALRLAPLLREMRAPNFIRAFNWLWCTGIVYSTIATGQHVAIDVLAGIVLGAIASVPRFFAAPGVDGLPPGERTH